MGRSTKCPMCGGEAGQSSVNRGLALFAEEVYVLSRGPEAMLEERQAEGAETDVDAVPITNCRTHPDQPLSRFCFTDMRALCDACAPSHPSPAHDVLSAASDAPALHARLAQLVQRCRDGAERLASASTGLRAAAVDVSARMELSCARIDASVTAVTSALTERQASLAAEATATSARHVTSLNQQRQELAQAAVSLTSAAAECEAAVAEGNPERLAAALAAAQQAKAHALALQRTPCAPTVVDVVVDREAIVAAMHSHLRVREVRVDFSAVSVSGPGTLSFAAAGNLVLVHTAGAGVGGAALVDLLACDVTVEVLNEVGSSVGTLSSATLCDNGDVQIEYCVAEPLPGVVMLHVRLFDQTLSGSPFTLHPQ